MRMIRPLLVAFLVLPLNLDIAFAEDSEAPWAKQSKGILENKITCLHITAENILLAGTDKALYRSPSPNTSFSPVLQIHGRGRAVNQIYTNPDQPTSIYSATDAGVFISLDQGRTWKSIFSPVSPERRQCFSIIAAEETLYVATADGLYQRQSEKGNWEKTDGELGREKIYFLQADNHYLYAATGTEIFRIEKAGKETKKIFSLLGNETSAEILGEDQEFSKIGEEQRIRDFIAAAATGKLYVIAGGKILLSAHQGEAWESLSVQGLPVNFVNKLQIKADGDLYAASDQGLFHLLRDQWQSDVSGLETNLINDLAEDTKGNLYAATASGIFIKSKHEDKQIARSPLDPQKYFLNEPTIQEVHDMAIAYANVSPAQINKWHHQSRARAFVPTLSVGLARADTELFHWDTGLNPDVLTRGRDYTDWSASFSWDFGDFVWSSDHTSIDSRSKLMSELRADILDQITRLYFELRRLQLELATQTDLETNLSLEKELRLEELTALIDGFTGGKFSQRAKKSSILGSSNHPLMERQNSKNDLVENKQTNEGRKKWERSS